MRARSLLIGALAVIFYAGAATAQNRPLANTRLPAHPEIVLPIPLGESAPQVFQLVLQRAGVPHGIEFALKESDPADLDLARRPVRTMRLNGLRLRNALDAIVREDPRYDWQEVNGQIIVRVATLPGSSALDSRIERFAVSEATLTEALAALALTLNPNRAKPTVGTFGVSLEVLPASNAPATTQRGDPLRASFSVEDATLLDILQALCRRYRSSSWSVQYAEAAAGPEHATIGLFGGATGAFVLSEEADRLAARRREGLVIPSFGPVASALSLYSDSMKVLIGTELLEEPVSEGPTAGQHEIDLTGMPETTAVASIVALDSRYVWEDAGGIYSVRPAPHAVPVRSLLDTQIDSFVLTDATAEAALSALVERLGPITGGSEGRGGVRGLDNAEHARRVTEERARTFSLALQQTTIRAALNALCRAHGALSWTVRPYTSAGKIRYSFTLRSYNGWSFGKDVAFSNVP